MTASGQHPIFHLRMYGPQAAVFAESFTGRLRYSGSSLGCHLACLIAGGSAPLIAAWLEPISKSSEEDNEASELYEPEEVLGVVFPTDQDAALPLNPGKEALHEPPSHIAA